MAFLNRKHEALPQEKGPWAEVMHRAGFTEEDTDSIHRRIHYKYFDYRGGFVIEEELAWVNDYFLGNFGHELTDEQKEYFRKHLEEMMAAE